MKCVTATRLPHVPETGADGSGLPHWPIARMGGSLWGTRRGAPPAGNIGRSAKTARFDLPRSRAINERGSDQRSMWDALKRQAFIASRKIVYCAAQDIL